MKGLTEVNFAAAESSSPIRKVSGYGIRTKMRAAFTSERGIVEIGKP